MELLKKTNDINLLKDTLKLMYMIKEKCLTDIGFHYFIDNKFSMFKNNRTKLYYKIWEYVRFNFSYKRDVPDELIISPVFMLSRKSGDCDDFALFILTALETIGIKSNFVLMGTEKNNFSHIAVKASSKILDPTMPVFNFVNVKRYNYFSLVNYIDESGNFELLPINLRG